MDDLKAIEEINNIVEHGMRCKAYAEGCPVLKRKIQALQVGVNAIKERNKS